MKSLIKPIFTLIFVLFIIIFTAYTGYWFHMTDKLEDTLYAWQKNAELKNDTLTYSDIESKGYPFSMTVTVSNLTYKQSNPDLLWMFPKLVLHSTIATPHKIEIRAPEHNTVQSNQNNAIDFEISFDDMKGLIHVMDGGNTHRYAMTLSPVYFTPMETVQDAQTEIENASPNAVNDNNMPPSGEDPTAQTKGSIQSLTSLEPTKLEKIGFDITISPSIDLANMSQKSALYWRNAEGQMLIHDVFVTMDPLSLSVKGEGYLSDLLQPAFKGQLSITGFNKALEEMIKSDVINSNVANLMRSFVMMINQDALSQPEKPVILPLHIKQSVLSVGPFPLLRLPEINWDHPGMIAPPNAKDDLPLTP